MIDRNAASFVALVALPLTAGVAHADESSAQALMREHKCYSCHADNDPLAGPAFVDVAAKFRGNPQAVTLIATFVRRGEHGGGPWHMPPHPELSPDQAAAIARYILSLEAPRAASPHGGAQRSGAPAKDGSSQP